jgi:protein-tyrosine phosphatase
MASWKAHGIATVFSVLTPEEETILELTKESREAQSHGLHFLRFPIPDRQVPTSTSELAKALEPLELDLRGGRSAVIHCRQGVGRSGLISACLLMNQGITPQTAVDRISAARGVSIPETAEQRTWIDYYAGTLAGTR